MKKRKPTIKQLKRRPAWWIDGEDIAISYPSGRVERLFHHGWSFSALSHQDFLQAKTFGGWL